MEDYAKIVAENYDEQKKELERQEKAALRQQKAAIVADMANLFADAAKQKAGMAVGQRASTLSDAAMKRREALKQGKAAMKAQYAKERLNALVQGRRDKMQERAFAAQEAARQQHQDNWEKTFAAQEAARAQHQDNWNKQFDAQEKYNQQMIGVRTLAAVNGGKETTQDIYDAAMAYIGKYPELKQHLQKPSLTMDGGVEDDFSLDKVRIVVAEGRRMDAAKATDFENAMNEEANNANEDYKVYSRGFLRGLSPEHTTFANESTKTKR